MRFHIQELHERVFYFKDNVKLKSQVHGMGSIIVGLRAERKLWKQELAQQGNERSKLLS